MPWKAQMPDKIDSCACLTRRELIKSSALMLAGAGLACSSCRRVERQTDCLSMEWVFDGLKAVTQVFEPSVLGGIPLDNRIIRSATTMGLADKAGRPVEELIRKYVELAQGGVGAIITGMAGIQKDGRIAIPAALMIHEDKAIPEYKKVTKAVHAHNRPIILQLAHAGRQTRSAVTGCHKVAPSAVRHNYFNETMPKALTELEIQEIISNFISAIERARKAGFDGVQLHAAHGYLLSDFLSSHANRRTDQWGGSIENRFRIIREIFKGAKTIAGDYPVLVKINAYDKRRKGMRLEEALEIARLLQEAGCAAIEVSCGTIEDGFVTLRAPEIPVEALLAYGFQMKEKPPLVKKVLEWAVPILTKDDKTIENYNLCAAQEIRQAVDIPVIVVGGIKKWKDIKQIIAEQRSDYVAMSRAFIIEPDIVNKFKDKNQAASHCISCCYCLVCAEAMPVKCFYGSLS